MIEIKGKKIKEIHDKLVLITTYLESEGYLGVITFDLTEQPQKKTLGQIWNSYIAKSALLEPESYMSEWSPNNGTHPDIIKAIESNPLYREIHQRWYDYGEKMETLNLIADIDDMLFEYLDSSKGPLTWETLKNSTQRFAAALDWAETNPKEQIAIDIQEVAEIFYKRNPSFILDW